MYTMTTDGQLLESRKADHIRINLDEDVASRISTGLERYRFVHEALPEVDATAIDTSLMLFGKRLGAPDAHLVDDRRYGTGTHN